MRADTDQWLSRILRMGVIAAAGFVSVGGTIYLKDQAKLTAQYGGFRGEPAQFRTMAGIVRDAAALHGPGLIQLGLLVLVATPIARVMFSFVGFLREDDRLYIAITLIVLTLLIVSLTGIK
jgi:uncharacterized membrane protein